MAALKLRDRDAIVTKEGLIFRVLGYCHPPDAYICDVEYAPSEIFRSDNPKAFRNLGQHVFYKFYEDEGLRFVEKSYPKYFIFYDMLCKSIVGINHSDIFRVSKPDKKLEEIVKTASRDELVAALHNVLEFATQCSDLSTENFGVFGSLLYGFYHPRFSDLDFIIYGGKNAVMLRETLEELYSDKYSPLKNEFESDEAIKGKHWRFRNYSPKEYIWHQNRKLIYALFSDENSGRIIKTEFEPVKDWKEINNEYDPKTRVSQIGWVRMFARITEDHDAIFIPSIYGIEPLKVLRGPKGSNDVERIISYVEEFRMQACRDEKVYVEGNLEEVTTSKGDFYQITLTYCPKYYEQVLKVVF